jgi:uncharacterized SAM-binding protein YcdF (DUF218 family)
MGVIIALLAAVAIVDGQAIVEKIIQRLVTPVGLLWIGLAIQFRLSVVGRRAGSAIWAAVLWVTLTVCGNGLIVERLVGLEEQPFLNRDPLRGEPFDVLIVLGGGASMAANGRPQVNTAGDRIVLAAELHQAGLARRIVCTGQRIQALHHAAPDPSEQAVTILTALGVPPEVLEQSGGANTAEEFAHLAQTIKPGQHVGLVTSAWHMPRALRLARKNGLEVEPVPADFQGAPAGVPGHLGFGGTVFACIPDAEALMTAAMWEKEQLARLVDR